MYPLQTVTARQTRAVRRALAAAAILLCAPAYAALYQIAGYIQYDENGSSVAVGNYSQDVGFTISRQVLYDNLGPPRVWHGRADSGADAYGLHASTFVGGNQIANGASGGGGLDAMALVRVTFTDFVISGPAGSGPIQTSINFHLSGQQILGGYTSASPIYTSDVASAVGLIVSAGSNGASGFNNFHYNNGAVSPATQGGLLVGFNGNANVPTPLWTLPVNTPFTLSVQLSTMVSVGVVFSDGYITSALSDFGNTLTFATDRPVFGLPAGYTANSAEAGVINNVFTSQVPEPASGALAAFGIAAVGLRARRRRIAAAAAAALMPLLAAAPAQAVVQFTVTNLGTLGGASSEGFAINASGQVAGRAYLPSGFAHATRWTNAVAEDLGTLGGQYSNAYGINDAGQVAGDSYLVNNINYRGVVWGASGAVQTLLGGTNSGASGINNSGAVVGVIVTAGLSSAAAWRNDISCNFLSLIASCCPGGRRSTASRKELASILASG